MNNHKIRNIAIIAHVDHGKSTLADRILEYTKTVSQRLLNPQHLDEMDLERERGITIKLNAIQIKYHGYYFHLIDTPGHVDFTHEVSRSLAATEGVLLLVDATQGIQAQTLANVYLALEKEITVIPIVNKIDLPTAHPNQVAQELEKELGFKKSEVIFVSAKTGENVDQVIKAIIERIPSPAESQGTTLRALVFDSYFDVFRGVILFVRVVDGELKPNDQFRFLSRNKLFHVTELGIKTPHEQTTTVLKTGEVGWLAASIRDAQDVVVGDTLVTPNVKNVAPLASYKPVKPVVYSGFYPLDTKQYPQLKDALLKIALSDSSITYVPETSLALGFGFRVGFLGLLHMEILKERIKRQFNVDIIATTPNVVFVIQTRNNKKLTIANPANFPPVDKIKSVFEPVVTVTIIVPTQFLGKVMQLCTNHRGKFLSQDCLGEKRRCIKYQLPLAEIILSFFDSLKSLTQGYATFDYCELQHKESPMVKIDVFLAGTKVDALSFVCHNDNAHVQSRALTQKLKRVLPRQNFEVAVQAVMNNRIIARETIKAYRKDVTAKLYGGDVTRRKKLLKKQKKGKARMKQIGNVHIPQKAFLAVLSSNKK